MSPLRGYSPLLQFWHFNKGIIIIIFGHRARISASRGRRVVSFCCRLSFSSVLFQLDFVFSHTWEMSPPPRTSMTDEIISFALDLCPAHCRRFLASSSAITQHNFTGLHSLLVRGIRGIRRFYPANDGPCRRIWTELYLFQVWGSFLRSQHSSFSKITQDFFWFRQAHEVRTHTLANKNTTRVRISPRRPSALLNPYVIAYSNFVLWIVDQGPVVRGPINAYLFLVFKSIFSDNFLCYF